MEVRVGVVLLLLGAAPTLALNSVTIYNTSGIIEAPADSTGGGWYEPNARYLWILDMQDSEVNIEVSLNMVDLGMPYTSIHDSMVNYTAGDFLLVGAGNDILQGDEIMFFGRRYEPATVTIRSGVGHIFFYSSQSVINATGFNITFNSTAKITTEAPTTTTPMPPTLSSSYVPILGIPVDQWFNYNDSFKDAISRMATDYPQPEFNMTTVNVSKSDVIINDAKHCHPDFCPMDNCVAYDFSLATIVDDEVVFSQGELDDMLADPSANDYIAEVFGAECQICEEDPKLSILSYTLIPICFVIFGVVFAVGAWKLTDRSSFSQSQDKYEQTKRERMEDQRRRSSGDISILGVGGRSIASQGSFSSRRFTMPFPKAKRDGDSDIEEELEKEAAEEGGYTYFDPDLGIANPAQYGLGGVVTDFTRKGQESHAYTNQAFVVDEENALALQRASFADDSDSSDSDNGGALSFRPKRRELTPKNQIEVPADVHNQDEGETAF
ncbi:uncharacterized protein LOC127006625 [Eriocheir sinensis]|uniref:uncharacterized protein LOC127006625 n=1 Tax=Eriocheir sinensis TaxID=95602 RepID=UPI0021C95747|nr:uncharacterized protein LOC127006625 [Eriocheir sinensis]